VDSTEGLGLGLGQQHGYLDEEDRFSFGPWFIAATRDGLDVRASYSYLDLHGCLGDVGRGGEQGELRVEMGMMSVSNAIACFGRSSRFHCGT